MSESDQFGGDRGPAGPVTEDVDDVAEETYRRLMRYDKAEFIENPQASLLGLASSVEAERSLKSRNADVALIRQRGLDGDI